MCSKQEPYQIYIPICFYFNEFGLTVNKRDTSSFTFQYVSILIHFGFCYDSNTRIYIPICFYFNSSLSEETGRQVENLHSNMFLF